jgi:precorrin-3B synthase
VADRSIRAVPHPNRRSDVDACPGALRLHAAADGPLARVRLPGGMLTGTQLTALRMLAEAGGDGALELTSRANVQLRALNQADPAVLAARLKAAALLPSPAHETVRNIAAPPLADATTRAVVEALDRALCADPGLAALPGRFLFAVGAVPMAADLTAFPDGLILLAGEDVGLRVSPDRVVDALLAAAHAFLAERAADPGGAGAAWRLRELPGGVTRVARGTAAALGVALAAPRPAPGPASRPAPPPAEPIGVVEQADGRVAVGVVVPLGRLTGMPLRVLEKAARLVVTPGRGVVVPDLTPEAAGRWVRELTAAGLVAAADSRWAGVTACAGRPGCAKALADVRGDATAVSRFEAGLPVHWVGCARGCGSPGGPHVRVEATPGGYAVARPGGAREIVSAGLGDVVAAARRP